MNRTVITGIDGSAQARAAADYAAALAARHDVPLLLIHAYETPFLGYRTGPSSTERARDLARETLDRTAAAVRAAHPRLEVDTRLKNGAAADILIAESGSAATTVVGCRGVGGFASLLLGSVSSQVAMHGHGAITVVRSDGAPHGPVVCGYDGSPAAAAALAYAAQEAACRHTPLVIQTTQQVPGAQDLLAAAAAQATTQHPALQILPTVVHGDDPGRDLVAASTGACLTVVGCRGRGGFAGLLLGSVSQTLVHHAAGPVAVIHPDA